MEEYFTELMMDEIMRTDPEFYEYLRDELTRYSVPDDPEGDDAA